MSALLATLGEKLAASVVATLIKKFSLAYTENKRIKAMLDEAYRAGEANGIAKASQKRQHEIANAPPPASSDEVIARLDEILRRHR